jgi:hypothetical protein
MCSAEKKTQLRFAAVMLMEDVFTVDINPKINPRIVDDGQTLAKVPSDSFNRWRCDPPYNENSARKMYGTGLPKPIRLLEAGQGSANHIRYCSCYWTL